jgi:hypothetical protein
VAKALCWIGDVVQVLVLDRFHPQRRALSQQASTACRSLKFHSRSKIRPVNLRDLLPKLGGQPVEHVTLPGPSMDFGQVGSQTGYHALASVVKALQPKVILETGTYLGVSTVAMALNAPPDCRIYTVDLPDEASPEQVPGLNATDQGHVRASRHRVGEAFLHSPLRERIQQIREDSMTFRAEKWLRNAEVVYIDGGHSLPCVTKDTENAFRVLAPGGTIIWDDYFHLYPDVVSFLDKLADEQPLHVIAGTNYAIYSRRWQRSA